MKERKLIKGILLSLILCAAAAPVYAQGGGKAEPLRIEFKRGAKSATVKGRVRHDIQVEYVFAARQGQQVTIRLASNPAQSALFELMEPSGDAFKLKYKGSTWSGVAPASGDYLIYVIKQGEIDSSSFSLTLSIK